MLSGMVKYLFRKEIEMSNNTVTMTFGRKIFLTVIVTFSTIVLLIPYLAYDFYNQFLEAISSADGSQIYLIPKNSLSHLA